MHGDTLEIVPVRCLTDNYAYLLHDRASGKTAVVDPSEPGPILECLADRGWKLDAVLNTHHHWDHVGGNEALKQATGCRVVGHSADRERIPAIDTEVDESTGYRLGESVATILAIPGHTRGHIAYWFPSARALFSGDTLFSLGCGRLFEGTAAEMWSSLSRLLALPDETRVYCGHEYTAANLSFALTLEPDNIGLKAKQRQVEALRTEGKPTVPSLLGEERRLNPFLRPDDERIRSQLGLTTAGPVKVFAEIRRRKDVFGK